MKVTVYVLIALIIFPVFGYSQARTRSNYIGYSYKGVVPSKTLPNGVKHMGGGLIGDIEAETVYGISQVEKGKTKMLWLESSTGKDDSGITGWKVLDVISFPALGRSEYLFFVGDPAIGCLRRGNEIPNLVGVGRINRRRGSFTPIKLWVASADTRKFVPVAVAGIKCEYTEP